MKKFQLISIGVALSLLPGMAQAQGGTWTRLPNPPAGVGVPLLLTDGTVLCHRPSTSTWYKLTPNSTGSYVAGTWSTIAAMPSTYGPLYFGSAVLPTGKVVAIGGEYNFGSATWTNLGCIYNPVTNSWTSTTAPAGWTQIGDTQSAVLPTGEFVIANLTNTQMAKMDPNTGIFTQISSLTKIDRHNEEGWTLLPDGTLLTVDCFTANKAEKYVPSLGKWFPTGNTPQVLYDPGSAEIGPGVLMYNGKVIQGGASGHNAVYTPGALPTDPGTWVAAPDFPNVGGQLDIADGPGVILPNGNVLFYVSPGIFNAPSSCYEWNGTTLTAVPSPPHSPSNPSYVGNFLLLPNGQVLFTDFSNDVEVYTPNGTFQNAWRPTITSAPGLVAPGTTFTLQGTQLNGLSQGSFYGDDSSNATNYPIVRITNNASGIVTYCKTHDHSTMAVATGATTVSTFVDVPASTPLGNSTIEVIANGIPSVTRSIVIGRTATLVPTNTAVVLGNLISGNNASLAQDDANALRVCKGFIPSLGSPFCRMDCDFLSPTFTATTVTLSVKAKMVNAGVFKIRGFVADRTGGGFVYGAPNQAIVDTPINTAFATFTGNSPAPGVNIHTDGTMRARIEIQQAGFSAVTVPCTDFEFVNMTVTL